MAFVSHRAAAARARDNGLQVMTVSQVAGRLAGGFLHEITSEDLDPAIARALALGGFRELEPVRHLPGMVRAVSRTLKAAWNSDYPLAEITEDKPRLHDLALIENRVCEFIPPGALLPAALRNEAIARSRFAATLLGPISISGVHFIEPIWRPLIDKLRTEGNIVWNAPAGADTAWFGGYVTHPDIAPAPPILVSCADPRHEVLEAFRWARELVASGRAHPHEIAFCAATTDEWDEHVLALAIETGLPICFAHGHPCLSTPDGQRCAALADVLLHGLNQSRVRRLFAVSAGQGTALDALPRDWLRVNPSASLDTTADWMQAIGRLDIASPDPRPIVGPLLTLLERGTAVAEEAAAAFLRGRARRLWARATRAAPAAALELSLRNVRSEEEHDPCDSVVWAPAWQLAASPRPFVCLFGLTERGWPRPSGEDPLLPEHIVSRSALDADPPAQADRRAFDIITACASQSVVLSRSRRNAQGGKLGPSPLLPLHAQAITLDRARVPEHAASEADRLAARPQERRTHPATEPALRCWLNWHRQEFTGHDGLLPGAHPLVAESLGRIQSPTSLMRLLRDPQGFVWRYALGWRAPKDRESPLTLARDEFGRLVHELLRRTVDSLEPTPGITAAQHHEIEQALDTAVEHVTATWPLERPVPPDVLWVNTVRQARTMAFAGLTGESFTEPGTRSWTEIPFGETQPPEIANPDWPWDPTKRVTIPGTQIAIRGKIDRLDILANAVAVRVTDYKTGNQLENAGSMVIAAGGELQRVLYGLACRELLPATERVITRLYYLKDSPKAYYLRDLPDAIAQTAAFANAASAALERGHAVPGPAANEQNYDLRLALPASPSYFRRKRPAFNAASGDLVAFWDLP